jgi:GT2 family glycosyltransferase
MRIAVLLTCFNRREKTLQCLRGLAAQDLPQGTETETILVDDGSKDGTSQAVLAEFPTTRVLTGDGSLYWCGGMRKAWREAAATDPDFYLLLNDDTLLLPGALRTLVEIVGLPASRIIAVAAIRDPETGKATYGGIRRKSGLVAASGQPEICDTFNANAVLVPRAVYQDLGIFHEAYTHGMGDFDYGYAATRTGIRVVQSAGFLGECERNALTGSWRDRSLSRTKRWKQLHSPKGLPFREWMEFNRRNAGWRWPIRTITPSIRVLLGL